MLRDYLAAMANTRQLPLRSRIVLLLAAGEADLRFAGVSWEDLQRLLGLTHQRHLQEEVAKLEAMRMIERLKPAGSRPWAYRLRPPGDWIDPSWTEDRKSAIANVEFLYAGRARVEAAFSAPETGGLSAFPRTQKRAPRRGIAPPFKGAGKSQRRPPQSGADNGAPLPTTPFGTGKPSRIDSEGREEGVVLSDRQKQLAIAFMKGTGAEYLQSGLLRGVMALAEKANGSFEAIVDLAADPLFGAGMKWPDRVRALDRSIHQLDEFSRQASCATCGAAGERSSCRWDPAEEGCPYGPSAKVDGASSVR